MEATFSDRSQQQYAKVPGPALDSSREGTGSNYTLIKISP